MKQKEGVNNRVKHANSKELSFEGQPMRVQFNEQIQRKLSFSTNILDVIIIEAFGIKKVYSATRESPS